MLNIHSIKTVLSIVVYLTFDDDNMTVAMICSRHDKSPSIGWLYWLFSYHCFAFYHVFYRSSSCVL